MSFYVVSSRGYTSRGRRLLEDPYERLDIINDSGEVMGTMPAGEITSWIKARIENGAPIPFANTLGADYIIKSDMVRPFGEVSLDHCGVVRTNGSVVKQAVSDVTQWSADVSVTWDNGSVLGTTTAGKPVNACIEFENGFVIGIFGFITAWFSQNFSTVSFKLFGQQECLAYGHSFELLLNITEYSVDRVCGVAVGVKEDSTTGVEIGKFVLGRGKTEYRGVISDVTYDRARYSKELLLGGI